MAPLHCLGKTICLMGAMGEDCHGVAPCSGVRLCVCVLGHHGAHGLWLSPINHFQLSRSLCPPLSVCLCLPLSFCLSLSLFASLCLSLPLFQQDQLSWLVVGPARAKSPIPSVSRCGFETMIAGSHDRLLSRDGSSLGSLAS